MMTKDSVTRTGAKPNMTNKSILLLMESRAKWTVLWWVPGDVMSSLNIQVWWWTGSFSQCLLCRLSNGLTLSFLWRKINTKTACAFCNNPALIQINMPHEGFGLNFCISTMTTLSLLRSTLLQWQGFSCNPPHLYKWCGIVWRYT